MKTLDTSVAIVGAGPVGLTMALRLASLGVDSVVLEANGRLRGEGSKALCMQKETLECWATLGLGEEVARRGVAWTQGRTYYRGLELFQTSLPALGRDHFPPFVNISQTEVEGLMVEQCEASPSVNLCWGHGVTGIEQSPDGVSALSDTSSGPLRVGAAFVVGADGARSTVRRLIDVRFPGHSHADQFLIADVRAELPFPDERRFFFDPPWNPGRTVLVHPQPGSVWRIDWQVPPDFDLETERASGRLDQRIHQIVGEADYEVVWSTAYRFHQRLAEHFRVGRTFLAGDAAHLMSPFGARGLNSGVADAENLAWKLARVLSGAAPRSLLDTYETERRAAAVENLRVTDATMRFMVPPDRRRLLARNVVLRCSRWSQRMRRLVDSGRLSQPYVYAASPIVEPNSSPRVAATAALNGGVAVDGSCSLLAGGGGHAVTRLRELLGADFVGLVVAASAESALAIEAELPAGTSVRLVFVLPAGSALADPEPLSSAVFVADDGGMIAAAYAPEGVPGAGRLFVVRPDRHIAAQRDLTVPGDVAVLGSLVRWAQGAPV